MGLDSYKHNIIKYVTTTTSGCYPSFESFFSCSSGVVETGLFLNMADCVIFGKADGSAETRKKE